MNSPTVFGLSLSTYTLIHVILSLLGIASGLVVMYGFLKAKRFNSWTALFLITTALTSLTGFGFPFERLLPSHKLGILSLIALAIAIVARYALHMAGSWRKTYVVSASIALYFNVFVLVVQLFEKIPALHAIAPTQTEAPFAIAQLTVLAAFIVLTALALKRFREGPAILVRSAGKAA